jgi:hypothetical protein
LVVADQIYRPQRPAEAAWDEHHQLLKHQVRLESPLSAWLKAQKYR